MNPQQNIYYSQHSEYLPTMYKQQFHDSGIVDENLSDETGSVEEESTQAENFNDDKSAPKKPSQSYLEIIAEAILKAPNRTMQLYEIYNYFQRKYRYFAEDVNKSWRNSVRHNLSLNECFVKAGRGANGKGHYWRIHELAEQEFEQGRFRRRRYRQQIRQIQMQSSSYEPQLMYPSNSYYISSPPPPSYQTLYPTSTENYPMTSSTPTSYPLYDPYSTSYYPQYPSMALSYASPHSSAQYDV